MANVDVSPQLLEEIEKIFEESFYSDPHVKRIYAKIQAGNADWRDAHELAKLVAKHRIASLEKAYSEAIKKGILPNDTVYQNIAEKTVIPALREDHDVISDVCDYVQTDSLKKAGFSTKPVSIPVDDNRVKGLAIEVANARAAKLSSTTVAAQIENFVLSTVDRILQANMDNMIDLGQAPIITRMRGSNYNKSCKYCDQLVYSGKYNGNNMPEEIFRRHRDCRCIVIYDPRDGSGKVQGAHSKQEYADYQATVKGERKYLAELDKMTPAERKEARNARARERRRVKKAEKRQAVKETVISIIPDKDTNKKLIDQRKSFEGVDVSKKSDIMSKERVLGEQGSKSLKKSIRKMEKSIEEHKEKIRNPHLYVDNWEDRDRRYQKGMIRFWEKEIKGKEDSIARRKEELRKRGVIYD